MGVSTNELVDIRVMGTLFNQDIVTTFSYVCITPTTLAGNIVDVCADLAADFKINAATPFVPFINACSPEYIAQEVQVQVIAPTRYRYGADVVPVTGANAQHTSSPNQSAFIERTGIIASRSSVGGIHIPGVASGNLSAGNISGGYQTLLNVIAARMILTWSPATTGGSFTPVIVHRPKPKADPPVLGYTWDILYAAFAQTTARVMRRRTIGVGK